MGFFDEIVEAAKSKDLWKLELLVNHPAFTHIDVKKDLVFTPAGFLAKEGLWESVEILRDKYCANTDDILFGAVVGKQYDEVMLHLSGSQNSEESADSPLSGICNSHRFLYKSKVSKEHFLAPIIMALAYSNEKESLEQLLSDFSLEEILENGLLRAALKGACLAGDKEIVEKLLNKLNAENKAKPDLSIDQIVKMNESMQELGTIALNWSAQGNHANLIKYLKIWRVVKFNLQHKDLSAADQNKFKEQQLILVAQAAAFGGHQALYAGAIKELEGKVEYAYCGSQINKLVHQLMHQACLGFQHDVVADFWENYSNQKTDFIVTICCFESSFDKTESQSHSVDLLTQLCLSKSQTTLIQESADKMMAHNNGKLVSHIRTQDPFDYFCAIQFKNFRQPLLEAYMKAAQMKPADEKKLKDKISAFNQIQRLFLLEPGHARLFVNKPELLTVVREMTELTKEGVEKQLSEVRILSISGLIDLIQAHEPRAKLIEELEKYLQIYQVSYLFGKNHADRAKSVLSVITESTSDDEFFKLINQQNDLLDKKENIKPILGAKDAPHNQSVSRRISGDGFTLATKDCRNKLVSQEQKKLDKKMQETTDLEELNRVLNRTFQ